MLPETVKAALVVLIAFLLHLACEWLKIPLDDGTLTALAIAIVAWLLGRPAGERVHAAVFGK
jgi:hypothetical protein